MTNFFQYLVLLVTKINNGSLQNPPLISIQICYEKSLEVGEKMYSVFELVLEKLYFNITSKLDDKEEWTA